jgi:hypothetical protein
VVINLWLYFYALKTTSSLVAFVCGVVCLCVSVKRAKCGCVLLCRSLGGGAGVMEGN